MRPSRQFPTLAVPGHFGELLQGRLGPSGPVTLITLPAPQPVVSLTAIPAPAFSLHFVTGHRPVDPDMARRFLRRSGPLPRAHLAIRSHIPPGSGAGVSTAVLLGLSRLRRRLNRQPTLSPEAEARHLIAAEGASDPLMFTHPARRLWASRAGQSLAALPAPPPLDIVGGLSGPPVATDPSDTRFADISDLVAAWPEATNSAEAVATLTTEAALRSTALRGGSSLDSLQEIAKQTGGLGLSIAHTGSARAILFRPGEGLQSEAARRLRALGLTGITRFRMQG